MNVNKKSKEIVDNFKEALEITGGLRESAYAQLAPVIHAVKTLPTMLEELDKKSTAPEEIEKVLNLASTLGKDADLFSSEMNQIDAKFMPIKSNEHIKVKQAVRDYTRLLTLSSQYHDVGTRFMSNTDRVLNDYTDICEKLLDLESSSPEQEVVTDGTE